jgi:hypothetical protein
MKTAALIIVSILCPLISLILLIIAIFAAICCSPGNSVHEDAYDCIRWDTPGRIHVLGDSA